MNVTRVTGITPQGSSNESYNVKRVIRSKKVAPVVSLNVSMQRFLGSSAILENDANNNLGECSICIPTNYFDPQSVDIACLMTEGIDFKEFNDTPASMSYYLANADWSVGCPILEGVKKYQQALAGDVTSFDDEGTLASTNPGRVATRMVYAGSRFCKIVKNEDGNLIGDCECCMKSWATDAQAY
jgi:hypothetical protein